MHPATATRIDTGTPRMTIIAPTLSWASPKEAYIWAVEYASRPDCRDSVGRLLKKPGTSNFTRGDLLDQALTITGLVFAMEHPLNSLYRLVYGDGDMLIDVLAVADHVSHSVHRTHTDKPISKLRGMAGGIVVELRRVELYGREIRKAAVAAKADIPRQRLYEPDAWGRTYIDTRTMLQDLLEIADWRLGQELDELGWLIGVAG